MKKVLSLLSVMGLAACLQAATVQEVPGFDQGDINKITSLINGITNATQLANLVYAGPTSGGAAAPTFRALVSADIPDISATYLTLSGVQTISGVKTFSATPIFTQVSYTGQALTSATTNTFDFSLATIKTLTVTNNVVFAASNVSTNGCTVFLTGGGSSFNLTFPAAWQFFGTTKPTAIAASTNAVLTLFSPDGSTVKASYSLQQ